MTEPLYVKFAALLAAAMLIPAFVFLAHGLNHRNMRFWWVSAASYSALFIGSSLGAMRAIVPETVAILVSNTLIGIGYFLCLRALRMIKGEWRLNRLDAVLTLTFLVSFGGVFAFWNSYEHRVALVSSHIAVISLMALTIALSPKGRISLMGDLTLAFFGIGNVFFASARSLSAQQVAPPTALSLAVWDQIFFVWSIAAVFCFAIGFFINGTAAITRETRERLAREQNLTSALSDALEGQRNLQKLMLHELKRPLNAISSTMQAPVAPDVPSLKRERDRLRQLSREANAYLEGISAFDEMNALLEAPDRIAIAVAEFGKDIATKWGVTVDLRPEAVGLHVRADALLLHIALGNLIENARKFGQQAQDAHLIIGRDRAEVTFDVIDDGPGIPAPEQQKVFGKFYKIGNSSGNALKGCGLGLYLVSQIATAHGGSARVLSQSPSTLRVAIPVSDEARL